MSGQRSGPGPVRDTLRRRLLLGAVTPLVLAAIAQAGYTVYAQRRAMMSGLEDKAASLASLMVNVAGPSLAMGDDKAVVEGLAYLDGDAELGFAAVARPDGQLAGYRGPAGELAERAAVLARAPGMRNSEDLVVAVVPIQFESRPIGQVAVGLRTARVKAQVSRIVLRAALISTAGGAAAIVVVLLLANRIVRRNRDMRTLLASVDQGFVTLRLDGTLAEERSQLVDRWLGPWKPGAALWDYILPLDPPLGAWLQLAWESLIEDVLPMELSIEQMPRRFVIGGVTLRAEYKPMLSAHGKLQEVLLVLTDISAELEHERAEAEQRELLAVCERISRDRRGFSEFFDDAGQLVARVIGGQSGDRVALARDLHTLKGNAGLFGLGRIAEVCHQLEGSMGERAELTTDELGHLGGEWRKVQARLGFLLGDLHDGAVELSSDEYSQLLTAVEEQRPHAELAEHVRALKLEPIRPRLVRFGEQAQALGRRLGKGEVQVVIEDQGLRLDPTTYAPFWAAFAHAIRNAIDHGLEEAEARRAAGKPEAGTLTLRALVRGASLLVEIEDDGRGVDWSAVANKARRAGLPAETRGDLEAALFADGVSTREEASEVSGRGVGLAAVRQVCRELRGSVSVRSVVGSGTCFTFSWPWAQTSQPAPARRKAG